MKERKKFKRAKDGKIETLKDKKKRKKERRKERK